MGKTMRLNHGIIAHLDDAMAVVMALMPTVVVANPGVLSNGLWLEIMTWLPMKSPMQFKCVSKAWLSIIKDSNFAKVHQHRSSRSLIVYKSRGHGRYAASTNFFFVNLEKKLISRPQTVNHVDYENMDSTRAVNSLTCFYNRRRSCLYNLATHEILQLPLSKHDADACSYHLVFDSVSCLFKILKICPLYEKYHENTTYGLEFAKFVKNLEEAEILTLGVDSSWRSIPFAPWEIRSRSTCCLDDGVLYWKEKQNRWRDKCTPPLVAFHLNEEIFRMVSPQPPASSASLPQFGPALCLTECTIGVGGLDGDVLQFQILEYSSSSSSSSNGPGILATASWTVKHQFCIP